MKLLLLFLFIAVLHNVFGSVFMKSRIIRAVPKDEQIGMIQKRIGQRGAFIVKFKRKISGEFTQNWTRKWNQLEIGDYLPEDSHLVVGDANIVLRLVEDDDDVEFVYPYEHQDKGHVPAGEYDLKVHLLSDRFSFRTMADSLVYFNNLLNEIRQSSPNSTGNLISSILGIIHVSRMDDQLEKVLDIIKNDPMVTWISKQEKDDVLENNYGSAIVQSGSPTGESIYTAAGLTGKGQIVGMVDGGLSHSHCNFFDNEKVPFVTKEKEASTSSHRKIQSFLKYMDSIEVSSGHGTHTAGTIAGKCFFPNSKTAKYDGIAPDAKLVFIDAGCQTEGGCQCEDNDCSCPSNSDVKCPFHPTHVYLPNSLEKLFRFSYDNGAKVFSASIGSTADTFSGYASRSQEIDRFVYNHPDITIVWSAGNQGTTRGFSTLTGASKENKNGLVVGASVSGLKSWYELADTVDYHYNTLVAAQILTLEYHCVDLKNSSSVEECNIARSLLTKTDCCDMLESCTKTLSDFLPKDRSYFRTELTGPVQFMETMCCKSCFVDYLENNEAYFSKENIAPFSSIGPAKDGRIKPDIVAPGYKISSAKAHQDECNEEMADDVEFSITAKFGTSMAAPIVAGSALLIRQYFEDGFYPTGEKNSNDRIEPSAALVRAVLIDSARPVENFVRRDSVQSIPRLQGPPGHDRKYEGYGLINLSNTLYLKGQSLSRLFVSQDRNLETDVEHEYEFTLPANANGTMSITLTWTDIEGSLNSMYAIQNDLDLIVEELNPTQRSFAGNVVGLEPQSIPDRINTVEKIVLVNVKPNSKYRVIVRGHRIVTPTPQNYALIATGPFDDGKGNLIRFQHREKAVSHARLSIDVFKTSTGIFLLVVVIVLLILVVLLLISNVILFCIMMRQNNNPSKKRRVQISAPKVERNPYVSFNNDHEISL